MPATEQIDFTKPFQFGNKCSTYSYEPISHQFCKITNINTDFVDVEYPCCILKNFLNDGVYEIIPLTNENTPSNNEDDAMKKLEDYIRAIHKSVPDETIKHVPEGCSWCECPDCKEAFAQEAEGCFVCDNTPETCDCGAYIETPVEYQETLLEAIKSFTQNTSSTVFMVDGEYEVYWRDTSTPFKAATDAEMWKLIEAVEMLEGAM